MLGRTRSGIGPGGGCYCSCCQLIGSAGEDDNYKREERLAIQQEPSTDGNSSA